MTLTIDVVSDVICPWCFLGKRRLDKALADLPDITADIRFRPFMLDPTIPPEGIDRTEYLTRKFGAERLKTLHDPLTAAGQEDGVPYAFYRITRAPNTLDAHRLIRWATAAGRGPLVVEDLFLAYWRDGEDVGDRATLARIAASHGIDAAEALESGLDREAVQAEIAQAQAMGVQGVPTFIFNGKYGVSGAQPAEVLADVIRKVQAMEA
jgi:predicted DsbA family dithiol-disulfide isomerase